MVPTRSRPDRLKILYESFLVHDEGNSDFVVGIDSDEKEFYSWVFETPTIKVIETPHVDYVEKANFMAERMKDYEYLYLLADDFVINSKWESIFLEEAMPNCVFYGRDSVCNSKLPTAVFIDNNIVKKIGYIAPPTLVHYFADNIWRDWGMAMNTYKYFDHVNVQHLHPVKYSQYQDEVYSNSAKHFGEDQQAYNEYIQNQLLIDLEKLK